MKSDHFLVDGSQSCLSKFRNLHMEQDSNLALKMLVIGERDKIYNRTKNKSEICNILANQVLTNKTKVSLNILPLFITSNHEKWAFAS